MKVWRYTDMFTCKIIHLRLFIFMSLKYCYSNYSVLCALTSFFKFFSADESSSYWLISFTNFNAQFLYSLTICMLHYNPRHVSNINMPIFMEDKFYYHSIWYRHSLYSTVQYAGWQQTALIRHTVQPFTESDDTRCCDNKICTPEDGHVDVRNMSRIVI